MFVIVILFLVMIPSMTDDIVVIPMVLIILNPCGSSVPFIKILLFMVLILMVLSSWSCLFPLLLVDSVFLLLALLIFQLFGLMAFLCSWRSWYSCSWRSWYSCSWRSWYSCSWRSWYSCSGRSCYSCGPTTPSLGGLVFPLCTSVLGS